ncbi:MAG: DUF429 domain-containing protein [Aeromicrobium erythreum]
MHYVGLDLAWGERRPTGVAVLDPQARLLHVATVRDDDEIVAALAPYTDGPCLVAVDAPLIVVNETGSRQAEKDLSADFRRFEAGAHPANLGKPEFRDGSRGLRICRRLGLDLDPRSGRERRGIEVYPHPATVVLFGLTQTLKYKAKPGRDLELLRAELLRLMDHVETVVTVDVTWQGLRDDVVAATRKSQLRVVEDQVDAVVCAYVGWFADRWPSRTTIYGDLETGYIVTPTLRDETARVHDAISDYVERRPALARAGERAVATVTAVLDDAGINYLSVTGRTKTVASFAEKASRLGPDGRPLYTDPAHQITDQVGVRVIAYVRDDVAAVAELLAGHGTVLDDRDLGQEAASQGRFGYASRHLLLELEGVDESPVQVQVRTVLQHAWAEFEHDIRYKGTVPPEHASDFDRRFTLAAGLLDLADRELSAIRETLRGGAAPSEPVAADSDDPRLEPRQLAAYLAGQYAGAVWSRSDHYAWISGLLLELGITSFDELGDVLADVDEDRIAARMGYRTPPGAVRRLDDALLSRFGERYVALRGNADRTAALRQRLGRLSGG